MKAYPHKEYHVICVYLCSKFAESILNETKGTVTFTCLYYHDGLIKYHKYITRGGVMIGEDEEDFNSQLKVFKKGNFVEFFRNLWRNYFN
jgi:hypothetical protein